MLLTLPTRASVQPGVSPDLRLLAVWDLLPSDAYEAVLYDISTPRAPRRLAVLPTDQTGIATFSPDSKTLAISTVNGTTLYDVSIPTAPTPLCSYNISPPRAGDGPGAGATFSSDGRFLELGTGRGQVAVITAPSCEEVFVSETQPGIAFPSGFVEAEGDLRVVVSADTEIRVLSLQPAHRLVTVLAASKFFEPRVLPPFTVQYDSKGSSLGTIRQSVLRGTKLDTPPEGDPAVFSVAEAHNGLEAVSVAGVVPSRVLTGTGQVVLSRDGQEVARIDTGRRFFAYVWLTPDGRRLVVGLHGDDFTTRLGFPFFGGPDGDAVAVLYDVTKPERPAELARHDVDDHVTFAPTSLRSIDAAASPDGTVIGLASADSRQVLLLDAETGAIARRLEAPANVSWSGLDFVDDHTLVGAGNFATRGTTVFWDLDSGQVLDTLSAGEGAVNAVAVNRRSDVMALGFGNGELTLFDA